MVLLQYHGNKIVARPSNIEHTVTKLGPLFLNYKQLQYIAVNI